MDIWNGKNITNASRQGPSKSLVLEGEQEEGNEVFVRCSLFQVHISASLILNGVAVRWVGHIDLERLEGTGRIEFDPQLAKVSWIN